MGVQATLDGDRLVLSTGRIERSFAWQDGLLRTESLRDLVGAGTWTGAGRPDWVLPGEAAEATDGQFDVTEFAGNAAWPAHTRATVTCRLGGLELRRIFRLYDHCPAIACDLYVRGTATGPWRGAAFDAYQPGSLGALGQRSEDGSFAPVTDRIGTGTRHLRVQAVGFRDVTDRRNNLVFDETILPYRAPHWLVGNVLLAEDVLTGDGLFILKEAPCSDIQLAWPGCDFGVSKGELAVLGLGIDPEDLDETQWTRSYGTVIGVGDGGIDGALSSLRDYQARLRVVDPSRDITIMANTWGDRSQDGRVSESFAMGELEAGRKLGITHLQLDDGWQTGRSGMSVEAGGSLAGIWERNDWWQPRPERFPNGLGATVERGEEVGIEVCLWYNPSKDDSYAHWEDDARTLIGLYREHGIRIFKIDGVNIPDKRADRNLRAIFDTVLEATDYQVTFNLDATAQRRFGYHYLNEYGNIFLANRYTDHASYYPHWTLRNLWQLSRYVPPQNLQMEFLNRWRNTDKYPADDPLAPGSVPFEYCFVAVAAAQPLAWFEVQNLPEEAFAVGEVVKRYREHQAAWQAGQVFPIGECPDGTSWTGFQSVGDGEGYLLLLREHNDRLTAKVKLWRMAGASLLCEPILGAGDPFSGTVDAEGRLTVSLPEPLSFALYRYRIAT